MNKLINSSVDDTLIQFLAAASSGVRRTKHPSPTVAVVCGLDEEAGQHARLHLREQEAAERAGGLQRLKLLHLRGRGRW